MASQYREYQLAHFSHNLYPTGAKIMTENILPQESQNFTTEYCRKRVLYFRSLAVNASSDWRKLWQSQVIFWLAKLAESEASHER